MSNESHKGWYAFDLDGTLCTYDGWKGPGDLGEPIAPMVERVKALLAAGEDVRIFTARAWSDGTPERDADCQTALHAIYGWCQTHIGRVLPVTCVKDLAMLVLYDDRCIQVTRNIGELTTYETPPCPICKERTLATGSATGSVSTLMCFSCGSVFEPRPVARA